MALQLDIFTAGCFGELPDDDRWLLSLVKPSSSSIYWTGSFLGVKSPIKACVLVGDGVGGGGGGGVYALLKQLI